MGIRHDYPSPLGRWRRRLGSAVAVAVLTGSSVAFTGAAAHAATVTPPVTTDPEAIASAQAQTTGKSVPVTADSTTTSTTTANPDGTFTLTDSPVPIQVNQAGSWVPVDATLQQNADGTFSPKAAASGVTFSGGGTTPLATLTNTQGQQVSISWPSSLPTPTVSGASATYASVLPGVDLQMTATTAGGYTEELIVKTATAAANPALQDIHFTTTTSSGLTLSTNAAGGLQATDATGAVAFGSPTATMWSTPSSGSSSQTLGNQAPSAPTAGAGTSQDDATPATPVAVNVGAGTVDIVPPASALTASTNTYPLVIDPPFGPPNNGWTWTSSNNPGTSYWEGSNNTHDTDAHVGYDDWCADGSSGCTAFGVTRSLFSFPMGGLAGKHVTGATLSMTEQGPTSSISGTRQLDLYGGGAISSSTTWNNQSIWPTLSASANFPSVTSNTTNNANFNVTSLVQQAVTNGYQNQTMVLQADNESDDTSYRFLIGDSTATGHPDLEVTYWSTPNLPGNLSVTNAGATTACDTTTPGTWIDKNDDENVTLNATLNGPDVNYPETADFWFRANQTGSWSDLGGPTTDASSTGAPVHVSTPPLSDGTQYQWQVYAQTDGGAYGSAEAPANASCYFRTDFTPPTISVNNSATTAPTTVGGSTGTGSLALTATDPGVNPSGVAKINYNVDGTSISSGGGGEQSQTGGTATIPLNPTNWGTHVVWYQAVDNAGNESAPQHFDYYVADGSFTPGTAGDLNGDGKPDLAVVDAQGNLRFYSDPFANSPNGTPSSTPPNPDGGKVILANTQAPNGTSFSGALIAHDGSFTGQTCDDIVIIESGSLHIATDNNNCSPTTSWTLDSGQTRPTLTPSNSLYNATDWSSVQQAIVLPPVNSTSKPALVTLENYGGTPSLWMYTAKGSTFESATLLASGSWLSDYTLMSPGLINGSPALWVRSLSTGALLQYTGIESWSAITAAPAATTIAASGYRVGQYPSITSDGPEDGAGPTMWATNKTGRLIEIPTTVNSSSITLGTAVPVSTVGWAAGIQTLEGVKPIHPTSTIGLYRSSTNTFYFDTANNSTTVDHLLTLTFAQAGDIPVTGDWSGTGVDGVGVYRPSNSTFYLDDSNTVSEIDHTIALGDSGDIPVVGDWNGDGITTVGVYRPSNEHFYLDDSLTSSEVDHDVWYGDSGDTPIVGDWTGTGVDSVGVYRPSTWQFIPATSLTDTTALTTQTYGTSGDTPITGDWTGSGSTGIGVWRSSDFTYYLDNSVTSGTTNQSTAFGISTDTPVTGDWNGM